MKKLIPILIAIILVVVIATQYKHLTPYLDEKQAVHQTKEPTGEALIGGPFTLTTQTGETMTEQDLLGKHSLVFFGFTNCPQICPTGLQDMGQVLTLLSSNAEKLNPIFITVDPARDDVEQMQSYLSNFDERIVGLTGTQAQIDEAMQSYRVYARKVEMPEMSGYMMDHSAYFYLMGPDGKYITHFRNNTPPGEMVNAIRKHLN